jgi:hypothetical protein
MSPMRATFNDWIWLMNWISAWTPRARVDLFLGTFLLSQAILFVFAQSTPGVLDRRGRIRGRDFLQFYVSGRIVALGQSEHLYDRTYYTRLQRPLLERDVERQPFLPLYPPTIALLFSPLGTLPYVRAVELWWLLQAACFLAAGGLLFARLDPPPGWRHTVWLGLASFFPVINTFWFGQLAALLLLLWVVGLELNRLGRPIWGGCVLSLLATKPQLAVGVALSLVLQRNLQTGVGFVLGILVQAGFVAAVLSPRVLADFAGNARLFLYEFPPDLQHGTAGILVDLLGPSHVGWALFAQLCLTAYASSLLYRIARSQPPGSGLVAESAAVLFTTLATPHLLTYDLTYLLIPIASLLALRDSDNGVLSVRIAVALYSVCMITPAFGFLGFSLVPVFLLLALRSLASAQAGQSRGDRCAEG